jgi:AraC-like DNA-binding protein
MEKLNIQNTDFQRVLQWPNSGSLDSDLLLMDDFSNILFPDKARRMTFIFIGLCTSGSISYSVDTVPQTVAPGDLVIVSERHVIDRIVCSDDLAGPGFIVSVPFFQEVIQATKDVSALFLFSRQHPVLRLKERDQRVFKEYFLTIRDKLLSTTHHFRKDLIRTLMLAMFYDLSNVIYHFQQLSTANLSRAEVIFTRFIKLVEENCRRERRVSWYAEQLGITPKYLSESVKSVSSRTPNSWIDNYVTLELRVILKNTSKSIREITEEMNFANQSFLGKFFKEHVGMSPSEYRRQ